MLPSYPKVYNIGHRAIANLFSGPVVVQEKVDGSQISFGLVDGEVEIRSKGAQIYSDTSDKLFRGAVDTILGLTLPEGFVFRGEVLMKPKHNTLKYERIPKGYIILFDVSLPGEEYYATPSMIEESGDSMGLETVPLLYEGDIASWEDLSNYLERDSVLGGTKIEGIVVKNYNVFSMDKRVAMGKYVSEAFKEVHQGSWKERNPSDTGMTARIVSQFKTEGRWAKAVQHLRDGGGLQDAPQDIGALIAEIQQDVQAECSDEIRDLLFKHYWKEISRGLVAGFPEWYKERLAQLAFEEDPCVNLV